MSEYKISRRIGRGGMAEVFLALQEGIGGFEKLVVLKRIFRHFCEDKTFVHMFLSEARLAASISHPNVVEILDIQQDEDGFFIIMEYLSGETLASVLDETKATCDSIPIAIACRIVAEVAAGLHHAHLHTNVDGELHPIIHRDVTPSNLLICYNGVIKIVDFGVAKALGDPDQSVPGSLKGKLAYLAPEQIRSEQIGPRTDVFQLGVVLHEMLTGKHLFHGENDHFTMTAVLENDIAPPSAVNPNVPPELDAVVLKALARDPADRTESADAMRRAIEQVLTDIGEPTSQHDVSDWMHDAFGEQLRTRLKLERECTSEMRAGRASSQIPAITTHSSSDRHSAEQPTVTARPHTPTADVRPRVSKRNGALGGAAATLVLIGVLIIWWRGGAANGSSTQPADAGAPPRLAATIIVDAAPADATTTTDSRPTAVALPPPPPAVTPTFEASVTVEPPSAQIKFDGADVGTGSFSTVLVQNGKRHRLRVSAEGYRTRTILFTDRPPPATVVLQRLARKPPRPRPGQKSTPVTSTAPPTGVQSTPGGTSGAKATDTGPSPGPENSGTDNINPWAKRKP